MRRIGTNFQDLHADGVSHSRAARHALSSAGWRVAALVVFALLIVTYGVSYAPKLSSLVDHVGGRLSHSMTVRQVRVDGVNRAAEVAIAQIVGARSGESLLSLSLNSLRNELLSVPWVKEANVHRRLPGTLVVSIVEHEPVALGYENDQVSVLNNDGDVISGVDARSFASLPVITGRQSFPRVGELFGHLAATPELRDRISGAQFVGDRRWSLFVDGRVRVLLPEESISQAISNLAELDTRTALLSRAVDAVDLRNSEAVVVKVARVPGHRVPSEDV